MELIDNYNKESKKVKPCENGCGRLIYWISDENAYFGVESGQKHICADQDPFIRKSQEQSLQQPEDRKEDGDWCYLMASKLDVAEDNFKSSPCNIPSEKELEQNLWTEERLIDELFLQLATTKSIVSHNGRCSIIMHKYYNQALALRRYIPIARPVPKFVVHLSDLSARLVAELRCLDDPQDVLKQAVGRIFENIDELQYHQSIARKLKVELVK